MGHSERDALRRELDGPLQTEILDLVVKEVRDTVPTYQSLHSSQMAEVRGVVRWVGQRLMDLWVHDSSLTSADLERARAIGRARAADGRSLEAIMRAYRVGAARFNQLLAERAGSRLSPQDVFALHRVWFQELDVLTEALSGGHIDAALRLDSDRDRARRGFLDDLLGERQASPATITDRARALGLTLPRAGVLLVAHPRQPATPGAAPTPVAEGRSASVAVGLELLTALDAVESPDGDALLTTRAGQAVLLLDRERAPRLGPLLARHDWRGALVEVTGVDALAATYQLARDALGAAPDRAFDAHGVLHTASAGVVALLNGCASASPAQVRRTVLGPLLTREHAHLAHTLAAYLRTGSATTAAEELHLHPQTLRYRMRRVRELTGLDLRDPWQRLMVEVAHTIRP
ncbi:helix-turn-helix domain-containing protein [Streptomyces sp. NPDC005438]|uniref:PucR family transcriptional regulator n=1 Tax=Streptomyces sp. NPDC005438 TaxID=3156880 RepID=UPI0033A61F08